MANIPTLTQRSVFPSDQALPTSSAEGSRALTFTGQSLQESGRKLKTVAEEMVAEFERLKKEDDDRELSKLDIELSSFLRQSKYGDGTTTNPGFLNIYGENAVNGYIGVQTSINKKVEALMKIASNDDVRKRFEIISGERVNQTLDELTNHIADERTKANAATSDARVLSAIQDASANWASPQYLEQSFIINELELGKRAQSEGWSAEVYQAALKEKNTLSIEQTVSAAIIGNVNTAQNLLNQYSAAIDGFTKADLQDKINVKRKQLVSDAEAAEARADRHKKRIQEENFKNSYVAVEQGKKDASVLLEELSNGTLDPSAYTFLTNRLDERNKPSTSGNQGGYLQLSIGLKTGAIEPSDIYQMIQDPSSGFNAEQQNKLMEEAEEKTNANPILKTDSVNRAREQITRVLSDPNGIMDKFNPIGVNLRWNNALREFDERIINNPSQNPDALAQDVLKAWRPTPQTLLEFRKPNGWPSNIPWGTPDPVLLQQGIVQTGENLQKRFENKEIDEDTLYAETERLKAYLFLMQQMQNERVGVQ